MKVLAMSVKGRRPGKTYCEDGILFSRRVPNGVASNMIYGGEFALSIPQAPGFLAAVSDGIGGQRAGEVASRFVLSRLAGAWFPQDTGDNWLEREIADINGRLIRFSQRRPEWQYMGATLSGVWADGDETWIFHTGNSRIYTTNGDFLNQLTNDHTENQGKPWRERSSAILSCLGSGNPDHLTMLQTERCQLPKNPGEGTILFTTDGVHDHMSDDELESLFFDRKDDRAFCAEVMRLALENNSDDDMSVMLITA